LDSKPATVFKTTAVKMPESETKGTSGGITTGTTETITDGITTKTPGTGTGGLKGMKRIVPSTDSTESNREHTGSIATNIRIVTIVADVPVLFPRRDNSRDGRPLYDYPGIEEMACPAAGGHGGVLSQSQNH
jgi:hypothetical protein